MPTVHDVDDVDDYPDDEEPRRDDGRQFFDLDFNIVSPAERAKKLKALATTINRWYKEGSGGTGGRPDAMILVMPEGYGKTHLVVDLIAKGFKIVFCTKSNAQLTEKEESMRKLGLTTSRYVSKEHNLQLQLILIGISPSEFKLVSYEAANPYAMQTLNEPNTINVLADLFLKWEIDEDPAQFFQEHYNDYKGAPPDGGGADVALITFAAFQAKSTAKRIRWWEHFGLIAGTRRVMIDEENIDRYFKKYSDIKIGDEVQISIPYEKVAVVYDDPDRSDVDWLRGVSDSAAETLRSAHKPIPKWRIAAESPEYWLKRSDPHQAQLLASATLTRNEKRRHTPLYKIVDYKNKAYMERPADTAIGYRLIAGKSKPKIIVTTTEWITGYFALQTLRHSGLRTADHVEVFHSVECIVTAISTTITRKANHAVLLPIIEKLRAEFPDDDVTLIADGLGCEFTLSSNKGRNDLSEKATIIKLSWPHPNITATLGAHFRDVEDLNHDLMIATLLADLGNQAIGRNQGFRFRGKQAIVLIDPKYHGVIMDRALIRYKLTPWNSQLPVFNKKTSKRAGLAAIEMASEQSALECRLLELIHNFHTFGLSDEARGLAEQLPKRQRDTYEKWLEINGSTDVLLAKVEKEAARRAKVAENVRRFRERRKAKTDT